MDKETQTDRLEKFINSIPIPDRASAIREANRSKNIIVLKNWQEEFAKLPTDFVQKHML
jgi:hypothetical protein